MSAFVNDPKPERRVKDSTALRRFRLEHIGEPCEWCEMRPGVQAHHVQFRSQRGSDVDENLLWVCLICHGELHGLTVRL